MLFADYQTILKRYASWTAHPTYRSKAFSDYQPLSVLCEL
jgi:hypothetical protein